MPTDQPTDQLASPRFPRASRYHPDWIRSSVSGGANSLWLTEWLTDAMGLQPGMRVLDLGCGRGASSVFLHQEFDVQVWATDLWFSADERLQRISDAGADHAVFPILADARALPFAAGFFDAIISIDSFVYYGTDDLYLNYLARFVKPDGQIGIAGAGLIQEIDGPLPAHLTAWWEPSMACLHTATWWRRHWERSTIAHVDLADTMTDGWKHWLTWQRTVAPATAWRSTPSPPTVDATSATSARSPGGDPTPRSMNPSHQSPSATQSSPSIAPERCPPPTRTGTGGARARGLGPHHC